MKVIRVHKSFEFCDDLGDLHAYYLFGVEYSIYPFSYLFKISLFCGGTNNCTRKLTFFIWFHLKYIESQLLVYVFKYEN